MDNPDRPIGMHISSDPETTSVRPIGEGARQREELKGLRLAIVADLQAGAPPPDWTDGDHRLTLDSADLGPLFGHLRPSFEISVPNELGREPERLNDRIEVDGLEVFTAEGLTERVPALQRASAVRDAIAQARAGAIGADELQSRLSEAGLPADDARTLVSALRARDDGAAPGSLEGTSLDRLLGLVDLSARQNRQPGPSATDQALDALVDAVAASAPSEVDRELAANAIADLDARIASQLTAIMADPELQRLEAAWRGIAFLARRADFRGGMRLDVLAASRDQLADALHHQILMPEHGSGSARAPLAAIVVDFPFTAAPADSTALADMAALGASLQVPVIATVDAAFFGFEQPTDLSRLGPLGQHLGTDSYIAFRKLRERDESQFLTLALPSFLLADPPGDGDPGATAGPVFGGGALLAAATLLASHAQTGWPTHIEDRRVDDLPVRRTRMGGLPAAVSFADRVAMDLATAGFFAFRAPLNRDHVMAGFPSVVKRPQGADPAEARAQSSLPAAVFSALAAHRVVQIQEQLAGLSEDEAAHELEERMASFMGAAELGPEAVTIQHLEEHETDEYRVFGIRLRPPRSVLARSIGVVLGATIPKAAA